MSHSICNRLCTALLMAMLAAGACSDEPDPHDAHGPPTSDGGDVGVRSIPCPEDTPELHVGLEAVGESGLIRAQIVDADFPPKLRLNDWIIEFLDAEGEPLADAEITMARPYMHAPGHDHDGIYPPVVTKLEEPGRFEIADLNLWMYGPWQIEIWVSSAAAGDDFISFPACND